METASFRTLSPNTMAYKSWSAFIALNNARVDTGSVADINEPNAKLKIMQIIIRYGKISQMTGCYWKNNKHSRFSKIEYKLKMLWSNLINFAKNVLNGTVNKEVNQLIKRTRIGYFYSKIRSQETSMANTDLSHEDTSFKSTLNFACLFAKKTSPLNFLVTSIN